MKNRKLLNVIGDIDDKYIIEAEPREEKEYIEIISKKPRFYFKFAAILASLALIVTISIPFLNSNNGDFPLELSKGVKVRHVENPPAVGSSGDIEWLTETELFGEKYADLKIVAFEGIVDDIINIECDYDGSKDYRAIAYINVTDVLRGDIARGSTVKILLPGPIDTNILVSETSVSSQMMVGGKGIFMPITYNENSIREENGKELVLLELAEYGLADGERWVFLESSKGLMFNKEAYPSLAHAVDLEEIKEIVRSKLTLPSSETVTSKE